MLVDNSQITDIPILTSINQDLTMLFSLVLNPHSLKIKTAVKSLTLLGAKNSKILVRVAI